MAHEFFTRADFNVPQGMQAPNIITNTAPIDAALPQPAVSLEDSDKSVILRSHLGRLIGEKIQKLSMHQWLRLSRESLAGPSSW